VLTCRVLTEISSYCHYAITISMSVLLIVGPKSMLAASHATPLVSHGEYTDGTDGRTDTRPLHYTFHYGLGQCRKSHTSCDVGNCYADRQAKVTKHLSQCVQKYPTSVVPRLLRPLISVLHVVCRTWSFHDLCYAIRFPVYDDNGAINKVSGLLLQSGYCVCVFWQILLGDGIFVSVGSYLSLEWNSGLIAETLIIVINSSVSKK